MKVVVKREYIDMQCNRVLRKVGESYDTDKARADELEGLGFVDIVKEKPSKPAEKPKASTRKTKK